MRTGIRMTADELERLPKDGNRYDLMEGELWKMSPAGFFHGSTGFDLARHIGNFVSDGDLGVVVLAETGFRVSRNPDVVLAPDIGFVAKANLPDPLPTRGFFPGCPDLAVEIISPSETNDEIEEKIEKYLRFGTRLVWIVRPLRRVVEIYRPGAAPQIQSGSDELDGADVLPGFRLSLERVFR